MSDADFDKKIQDLAQLALDAGDKDRSWIAQLIGAVLLLIGLWYTQRQLEKKNAELAKLRAEAELRRLNAQQDIIRARYKELQLGVTTAVAAAKQELEAALELEAQTEELERVHRERLKKIAQIREGDWDTLNKLAGIK